MRVLLVNSHPAYRRSLRALLTSFPGVVVVGDMDDPGHVVEIARLLAPDVILLGIALTGAALPLTRQLAASAPGVAVVVVSFDDDEIVRRMAIEAGAIALVAMGGPPAELMDVLAQAAARSRAIRDTRLMTPGTSPPENDSGDSPG